MKHILTAATALALAACTTAPAPVTDGLTPRSYVELTHPDWSRDAVIYEVNIRQYSEAGTFDAVREDLPRLSELGVDILWLMPIHPIGEVNRKGTLGSYYSVRDYFGVNPEFGTKEDFRRLVDEAHAQGFHVILDWVANHTAWDHPFATEHPDWYEKDWNGDFRPTPWWDWSDIIDLDFSQPGVRRHMSDAMAYWVEEFGVDGFRADVAGYVPLDFWEGVRARLDAIRPVFMLAEWETRDLHKHAFDATYWWEWKDSIQDIAQGKADMGSLYYTYSANESAWPMDAMRMTYTDNHDQNTWDGLPQDIYGDAYEAAIVLQFTGEGIPLIYSGQECANPNRLEFFEKDPIVWNCDDPLNALFRDLIQLKTDNPVLHNGAWGARTTKVENTNPDKVFSFIRRNAAGNAVLVTANLSDTPQSFAFTDALPQGDYTTFRTNEAVTIGTETRTLPAWGWAVHVRP
ncbi:MAG: alpha-amylase family glycosyl hydrolase [Litorimonas sp.]